VADMLTAYELYTKARMSLFSVETNSQIVELSRITVVNYLENRSIWEELNYYKIHGQLLGKHKMFERWKRNQVIREMNIMDMFKLKMKLEHNLVVVKGRLRKEPNSKYSGYRLERVEEIKAELLQINQLMNYK
jgi:hypothetical protein